MRVIPLAALQSMYALDADEFPIILVTLSRGENIMRISSDATERVVDDPDLPIVYGTISRTLPFYFFPFELTLPQDQVESVPRMQIVVENVSAEIGWWLRSSLVIPLVTVEIVSSGDVDNPIATFPDFELSSFKGGSMTIQGNLTLSNLEKEPFPGGTFSPTCFPGLF